MIDLGMTRTRIHRPESSNIASMKMSYDGKYVYVTFKNQAAHDLYNNVTTYYRYTGVSVEDFYTVLNSPSVGSAFHKLIKNHPFIKVSRQRDPFTGRFIATKKED